MSASFQQVKSEEWGFKPNILRANCGLDVVIDGSCKKVGWPHTGVTGYIPSFRPGVTCSQIGQRKHSKFRGVLSASHTLDL